MGYGMRLALVLYALIAAALSGAIALIGLGWTVPLEQLELALSFWEGQLIVVGISTIFTVISLWFMAAAVRHGRKVPAVSRQGKLGEVTVSLTAISHLVDRVASHVTGVREVTPIVRLRQGALSLKTRVIVDPDTSVPDLSERLQTAIEDAIKDIVGVDVSAVNVQVDDFKYESRRGRLDTSGHGH